MKPQANTKKGYRWLLYPLALFLAGWLLFTTADPSRANSTWQTAGEGEQLFQKKCSACHTIGKGDLIGPDLQGVTQRRDSTWLVNFISQPDKQLASGDPTAQGLLQKYKIAMPNLGLTDVQVLSLVAYLTNPGAVGSTAPVVLSGGLPQAGGALFSGQVAFTNGGTPCITCHSTAGVNAIGGGTLGPDLTHVYGRLGAAGLSSGLVGLPFPTMQGVFVNNALTAQEQADLFAYFQETDRQPAVTSALNSNIVLGLGAAGVFILFGVMLVFWPRQRESISARLRRTG